MRVPLLLARRKEKAKLELIRVYKKLAEAQFFLGKLREQDCKLIGDKQPFDYYLSAFLSAGRTVDYRLRHEQAAIYPAWRTTWDASLTPEEKSLIKFMVDDRNVEVHASGSSRSVAQEGVKFPIGTHHVEGGTIDVGGPPGMEPAVILKPTYNFTIVGAERNAIEACASYLALLQRMVDSFAAARAQLIEAHASYLALLQRMVAQFDAAHP